MTHVLLFVLLAAQPAGAQPAAAPVVHASLDRTAVWVGDRIDYTVEIVCPKGVDILADDLAKEKLKTAGLDIVGLNASESTAGDDSTTHRITYQLTTYRVDTPELRVEPIAVRYFVKRPGQRLQDEAPAGEIQVPAAVVAFRSTLADNPDGAALRAGRAPAPRKRRFALAGSIGAALMLISVAPLAFATATLVRRRRPRRDGKSARRVRQEKRVTMEALEGIDLSTAEGRRRAFEGIDALVRSHLRDAGAVQGPALTPPEVVASVADRKLRAAPETIASLLAACERARYGPPDLLPPADECREAIDQTRMVVAG